MLKLMTCAYLLLILIEITALDLGHSLYILNYHLSPVNEALSIVRVMLSAVPFNQTTDTNSVKLLFT